MHRVVFLKAAIIVMILSSAFISCFDLPDEVLLPTWQVNLNVPLINKSFTLSEIINENPYISVDSSSGDLIYLFQSDNYLHYSDISEFMSLDFETSIQNIPMPASDNDSAIVYVEFPDSVELENALFSNGNLALSFYNPSSHRANINIRFPAILTPNGENLSFDFQLAPAMFDSVSYSLANHRYQLPPGGVNSNKLQIVSRVSSAVPMQTYVIGNLYISNFSFISAAGLLPPKSLGYSEDVFELDVDSIENFRDKLILAEALLEITAGYISPLQHPVDVEVRNLNIIGIRNDGTEFFMRDSTGNIFHTLRLSGASVKKNYTEQNSNINEFVAFLPDSIIVRAEYIMNPDHKRVTASIEDSIKIETEFSTRSILSLHNAKIQDVTSLEIGQKDRDLIEDGRSADFIIEVETAIPVGMWLRLDLNDSNGNYLFTITKDITGSDSVYFEPAEVSPGGEVTASIQSQPIRIVLDSAQVEMLSRSYSADFYVTVSTKHSGNTPPVYVAVRPSAWLKIKAYCTTNYNIDIND
ncbi:MAG: hypothetical protein IPM56_02880 [Ignavibacteriales bacterium]|nr:MAG: hypothetical protein IPM56_02880 [Ignavibacteriales bacterium]